MSTSASSLALRRREPPHGRRRSVARDLLRVFLVLFALTFVLRLPAFFVPVFNSDETFLATQAHVIEDGGQLYEEAADRKPPLVPYVYAATFAFFGTSALWSVRVVAMVAVALTALLLTVEARRRYGDARRLDRRDPVRVRDGRVRAAGRPGRQLRGVHAAVDDGGDPVRAPRQRASRPARWSRVATMAKQTGAATLLPVLYLLAGARGKRGVGDAAVGFTVPTALVALAVGPAQLFYWAVLGNGSYLGIDSSSALVIAMFARHDARLGRVQPAAAVEAAAGVARPRRRGATTAEHDTDLWLWLLSAAVSVAIGLRFFGHYYMQLVPPLALLAAGALSALVAAQRACHRRGAR